MKLKNWFSVYENLREEIEIIIIESNNEISHIYNYHPRKLQQTYSNLKKYIDGYLTCINTIINSDIIFKATFEDKKIIVNVYKDDKIIDKIKPL